MDAQPQVTIQFGAFKPGRLSGHVLDILERGGAELGWAKSKESAESRRVHELLTNAGMLPLFIAVPGLRKSFLPVSPAWVP